MLLLAVAVLAAPAGCGQEEEDDPLLVAFRQEEIAAFEPAGGTLELDFGNPAHSALGKPSRTALTRVFTFDDTESQSVAWRAAVAVARDSGWQRLKVEEHPTGELAWAGKTFDAGPATLSVSYYRDEAGTPKLSIDLDAGECTTLCS